jgi:lysophospholipase L1-like esterase
MSLRHRNFRPALETLESRDVPSTSSVLSFNPGIAVPSPSSLWRSLHDYYTKLAHHGGANVLFLGDSITQRWLSVGRASWNHYFAPMSSYDFGISGDVTQTLLWRISHGELTGLQPKVVVLMIGTNNLSTATSSEIVGGIHTITNVIQAYAPSARILLLGILPRGGPQDTDERAKIAAINQELPRLDNHHTLRFLNVDSLFSAPDGEPLPTLLPDQLHPGAVGYQVLGKAIYPWVRSLLTSAPTPPTPAPTADQGTNNSAPNTQSPSTPAPANNQDNNPPQQPTISFPQLPSLDGNAASQIWAQLGTGFF